MNSDGQKGQDRMFVSNGSLTSSLPSEQHREGTKIFDVTMINEFIDSIEISPEERAYYQSQFSDPRYFTRELFLRLGGQTVISTKRLKFTMQYALSILQVSKSISIVWQLRAQKLS